MLLEPNQIGQWLRSVDQHDAASIVEQCFLREDFVDLIEPIHGGKEVELFNIVIETPGHIFKRLDSDLSTCADQVEYAVRGCAAGVGVSIRCINWVPMVPPAKRPDSSSSVVSADTSIEDLGAGSLPVNKSFDVFLSHNSKDKPAVRELAEALRARGLKVWLDEWELVPGRPWQEALEEIIETTGASAVLIGKDGLGPWQDKEMRGCLSEFVERNLPVIPVLLPGAPETPTLPIFLKGFTWVDLRGGLTEEGIGQLQWGITDERPQRSKPSPTPTAAPLTAVASHPKEVVQIPQRRPRVMVEHFMLICREHEETGEEYYVEALRVLNVGEEPAVSLHIETPEFLGRAVQLREKPRVLRPGDTVDLEVRNMEKLVDSVRNSRPHERGWSVKIPLRVEYRDLDHRRWSTDHAVVSTVHGIVVEIVHPDEPPEWTDLTAVAKAASRC